MGIASLFGGFGGIAASAVSKKGSTSGGNAPTQPTTDTASIINNLQDFGTVGKILKTLFLDSPAAGSSSSSSSSTDDTTPKSNTSTTSPTIINPTIHIHLPPTDVAAAVNPGTESNTVLTDSGSTGETTNAAPTEEPIE